MMEYSVEWAKSAEIDLEKIIEYIKIDSINIAKKIFFEIKDECNELYYMPERKRVVPELEHIGIFKYREVIHKRWRIIFKIENLKVFVLVVADSSRNFEDLLFQRLMLDN